MCHTSATAPDHCGRIASTLPHLPCPVTLCPVDPTVEVIELDPREAATLFDGICRREMRISGADFLEGWDAGLYRHLDPDVSTGVVEVLHAVPLVREI